MRGQGQGLTEAGDADPQPKKSSQHRSEPGDPVKGAGGRGLWWLQGPLGCVLLKSELLKPTDDTVPQGRLPGRRGACQELKQARVWNVVLPPQRKTKSSRQAFQRRPRPPPPTGLSSEIQDVPAGNGQKQPRGWALTKPERGLDEAGQSPALGRPAQRHGSRQERVLLAVSAAKTATTSSR